MGRNDYPSCDDCYYMREKNGTQICVIQLPVPCKYMRSETGFCGPEGMMFSDEADDLD
jgi:hypothetical protein